MKAVIEMAREAGFNVEQGFLLRVTGIDEDLERFAELVIANNPPRSSMAWQERYEAGKLANRQEGAQVSPLEFVTMTMEKEHLVGKPIIWAQWPNEEKT